MNGTSPKWKPIAKIAMTAFVLAALGVGLWLTMRRPPYTGPYRHVILITLDTVRADHLGCYDDTIAKTPNLDRLAAECVRFDQAMAPAPTTLASHASLLTGVYPHKHGAARNGCVVHSENQTIAERLADEGFESAAFISSVPLDRQFGLSQGFSTYDQTFTNISPDPRLSHSERRADDTTEAVLDFLDGYEPDRLFLWVHYFDAHAPFDPPPPYDTLFPRTEGPIARTESECIEPAVARLQRRAVGRPAGRNEVISSGLTTALIERSDGEPMPEDEALDALYRGEIAFLDEYLGRLLTQLRDSGILDEAILIVTADHGETMWEHGDFWNHGLWVYDTTVRVPLLIRLPGAEHGGITINEVVSTVDIMPTVLDLLELPATQLDGQTLAAAWETNGFTPRAVFSEATQPFGVEARSTIWANESKPRCIREGAFKYIHAPYLDYEELFNIEEDPAERNNLLRTARDEYDSVANDLRAKLDAWHGEADPLPTVFAGQAQGDAIDRLKGLGYIGGEENADNN